jgi:enoyl-CoA hydratase/carnithine racemase
MFMSSEAIEVKVTGSAGTIVLNRPDYGNALTRAMVRQFEEALDDLYLERRVRAIIVTGAGAEFCRGMDLAEIHSTANEADALQRWGEAAAELRGLLLRMLEITKPIIAAVNGSCLGIGTAVLAAADVVVAADQATVGLPETRQGMVAGLTLPLVAFRVGAGQAARLSLTGHPIEAAEAQRIGLVHELIATDRVWARAVELAEHCGCGSPEAVQLTKRLVNETLGEVLATHLSSGAVMAATALSTPTAREGIAAMLDGRTPNWDHPAADDEL